MTRYNDYFKLYAKTEAYKTYQSRYKRALMLLRRNHPEEFKEIMARLSHTDIENTKKAGGGSDCIIDTT